MPSVRGRERSLSSGLLIGSATLSGAAFGLFVAVLVTAATRSIVDPAPLVVALVAGGVVLDASRLIWGRPAPPAVGRQVPRAWAALLPAPVTAVLYGGRLGVGPLTLLSTWIWWSCALGAGLLGPWSGALVGAVFGLIRMLVTVAVSVGVDPSGHAEAYSRLRRSRRSGWRALTWLAAIGVAVSLVGCGGPDRPLNVSAPSTPPSIPDSPPSTAVDRQSSVPVSDPAPTTDGPLRPAALEDVVRTELVPTPPSSAPSLEDSETPGAAPIDTRHSATSVTIPADGLAESLIDEMPGFSPIPEPEADRPLDLAQAAAIQPDPSEETALLETRGFRGGWTRGFRSPANDVAVVSVYEFADPGEARFYLEDGLITIGGYGGKFFEVDDLPGVRGFVQDSSVGSGQATPEARRTERLRSLGASFHHGSRWYLVYLVGSPDTVSADVLLPTLRAQRDLATAGSPIG